VHVDCENSLRLVFIEQWTNRAALLAHFAVPASRNFVRALQPLAAAAATIEIYEAARLENPLNQSMHSWIATAISYCNAT
jgi:quinol monooxygenase YgiN